MTRLPRRAAAVGQRIRWHHPEVGFREGVVRRRARWLESAGWIREHGQPGEVMIVEQDNGRESGVAVDGENWEVVYKRSG